VPSAEVGERQRRGREEIDGVATDDVRAHR
jgi:hypothetical protein